METSRQVGQINDVVGASTNDDLESMSVVEQGLGKQAQDDDGKTGRWNALFGLIGRPPAPVKKLHKAIEQLRREGDNLDVCAERATAMWLRWFHDTDLSAGQQLAVYTHLDPEHVKVEVQAVIQRIRAADKKSVKSLLEDGLTRIQIHLMQQLEKLPGCDFGGLIEAAAVEALVWNKLTIVLFEEKELVKQELAGCETKLQQLTSGSVAGVV